MYVAVDFDGTLVDHADFPDIGELKHRAIEGLLLLKSLGHKVALWTCREGKALDSALLFLEEKGVFFDAVNEDFPEKAKQYGKKRKMYADVYLDDRAWPAFLGWDAVINKLLRDGTLA